VKLARRYALVRLTLGLQGKDYDEAAKSAAAAEAYRLSLERCVARNAREPRPLSISIAHPLTLPLSQPFPPAHNMNPQKINFHGAS
jgi:hypothetical protein